QDIHEELERPGGAPRADGPASGSANASRATNSSESANMSKRVKAIKTAARSQAGSEPPAPGPLFTQDSAEAQVLDALGYDPVDADTLQARTGIDIARLGGLLLRLELDDVVARLEDGRYQRTSAP